MPTELTAKLVTGTPAVARATATAVAPATVAGRLVVRHGQDSDMLRATYDPRAIAADVFDLGNHTGTVDTPTVTLDGGLID